MNLFYSFQEEKIKPYLKMANQRIQITNNRKSANVKNQKREIATLLSEMKEEKARIKVEHVIREDFLIEAYELLELMCELVHERVKFIASEKECPRDLNEAVSSLIWAAARVDITEMEQIKKQLVKKYGSKFAANAENNVDSCVNIRLFQKLSVQPPSAYLVVRYLEEIAKEYKVDWVSTDIGLGNAMAAPGIHTDQEGSMSLNLRGQECTALPVPSPSGFSVPMAPGSNLSHAYSVPSHVQTTEKSRPSSVKSVTIPTGYKPIAPAELPQPVSATALEPTPVNQRSSSYTQQFHDEDYTYPCDKHPSEPAIPAERPISRSFPPPPYEDAPVGMVPKLSKHEDLEARFAQLQRKS